MVKVVKLEEGVLRGFFIWTRLGSGTPVKGGEAGPTQDSSSFRFSAYLILGQVQVGWKKLRFFQLLIDRTSSDKPRDPRSVRPNLRGVEVAGLPNRLTDGSTGGWGHWGRVWRRPKKGIVQALDGTGSTTKNRSI